MADAEDPNILEEITKKEICKYQSLLLLAYINHIKYLITDTKRELMYIPSKDSENLLEILSSNLLLIEKCLKDRN